MTRFEKLQELSNKAGSYDNRDEKLGSFAKERLKQEVQDYQKEMREIIKQEDKINNKQRNAKE